jgi:hypothetical protein
MRNFKVLLFLIFQGYSKSLHLQQRSVNMRKVIFLFFTLFLVLNPSGFNYGAIPASERAALITLYKATAGDNWKHNNGWKTPPLHSDGFAMPGELGDRPIFVSKFFKGTNVFCLSRYYCIYALILKAINTSP